MDDFRNRTRTLLGNDKTNLIKESTAAVFGLGGVGSYALESIARAGFGTIIICDFDIVDITNINRQLLTLHSNIGKQKCELAQARIHDINPDCSVHQFPIRVSAETLHRFDSFHIDIAIDCIDSVEDKINLIEYLAKRSVYTVTSMGAAQRLNPNLIETVPVLKTSGCPLAKKVRKALRDKNRVLDTPVNYSNTYAVISREAAIPRSGDLGSISYLPALFGLHAGAKAIDLILTEQKRETNHQTRPIRPGMLLELRLTQED
jgi:tRNA A37 threonylcarbamoyladenosine dehydratase